MQEIIPHFLWCAVVLELTDVAMQPLAAVGEGDTFRACFNIDATPTSSDFTLTVTSNSPGTIVMQCTSSSTKFFVVKSQDGGSNWTLGYSHTALLFYLTLDIELQETFSVVFAVNEVPAEQCTEPLVIIDNIFETVDVSTDIFRADTSYNGIDMSETLGTIIIILDLSGKLYSLAQTVPRISGAVRICWLCPGVPEALTTVLLLVPEAG